MALVYSSRHREREPAENRRNLERLQQQGRTSYGNLLKTVLYIICTNLLHIHLARVGVDLLYFSLYNCDWEEPRECLKIRVFEMSERRAFQCTVHGGQAHFFFLEICLWLWVRGVLRVKHSELCIGLYSTVEKCINLSQFPLLRTQYHKILNRNMDYCVSKVTRT
jgi:hypothetical protein